jgi:ankyrin repeat protein
MWKAFIVTAALILSISGCARDHEEAKSIELHEAIEAGDRSAVRVLTDADANLEARDENGMTPLLHALASQQDPTIAKILIEAGANVDATAAILTRQGERVTSGSVFQLVIYRHPELVPMLIDRGADVNISGESGITPLQAAVETGNESIVKLLLSAGAEVNARNSLDFTALHFTVAAPNVEIARRLVAAGADVDVRITTRYGNGGATPLMLAASAGYSELAVTFLDAGASFESKDGRGRTPLHQAAAGVHAGDGNRIRDGHLRVAARLLELGADVNARDGSGRTPLDMAKRAASQPNNGQEAQKMIELLTAHGGLPGETRKPVSGLGNPVEPGMGGIDADSVSSETPGLPDRLCPECGSSLPSNGSRCTECGHRFSD